MSTGRWDLQAWQTFSAQVFGRTSELNHCFLEMFCSQQFNRSSTDFFLPFWIGSSFDNTHMTGPVSTETGLGTLLFTAQVTTAHNTATRLAGKIGISIGHGNDSIYLLYSYIVRSSHRIKKKGKNYMSICHFVGMPSVFRVGVRSSALQPSTPMMFEQSSAMTSCSGYRLTVWILFAGVLNSPFRTIVL